LFSELVSLHLVNLNPSKERWYLQTIALLTSAQQYYTAAYLVIYEKEKINEPSDKKSNIRSRITVAKTQKEKITQN